MPTGHFCPWSLGLACHRWGARKRWGGVPNGKEIDVDTTGLGSNVFLMVPTCLLSVCAGSILYLEGLAQSLTALGFGFEVYLIPVTEWQS